MARLRRMLATSPVWLFLFISLCEALSSSSTSPVTTTTLPDSEDPRFIGYYLNPTSTQRLVAGEGREWRTSGRFAGDCSATATSCVYATDCADNTLYMDDGSSGECFSGASCVQFTILQTSPDGWPSATNFECRVAWSAYTVYRELATSTSSISTSTSLASSSTPSDSPTTSATSPSQSVPGAQTKSSASVANTSLIVAAVVPSVIGFALLVAATWVFLRLRGRKQKEEESRAAAQIQETVAASETKYGGDGLTLYYPSELDGRERPAEMAHPPFRQIAELPGRGE
ncbi:hypothetical protein F5Y10DRAFT_81930 [Nemania abortiva]|nr:hypothetical protein F5Y10DRAFT_81930 [Nemania abortiva]